MKKIVLVGGCGFIGHNLAINLLKRGHRPTVIDSLSVNNLYSIDISQARNHKLYTSILNNRIDLLRQNKIDLIIQDAREYSAISNIISRIKPITLIIDKTNTFYKYFITNSKWYCCKSNYGSC